MTLKTALKTILPQTFWLLPFLFFLAGYYALTSVFSRSFLSTPSTIGLPLDKALNLLSHHSLSARIIGQKEDLYVPASTILSQNPSPSSSIRPGQTVFLVTSTHPKKQKISSYIGLVDPELTAVLKEQGVQYRIYSVPSIYPQNSCIAQTPDPGTESNTAKELLIYKAAHTTPTSFLMPQLENKSIAQVVSFLEKQGLPFTIFHSYLPSKEHSCATCKVVAQKPLAGSYIQKKSPPTIQLQVND